jgi:phosphopantothenoylcysteine decarboxylase/phosphopantothenate--cysteine ligase
MATILQGKHIVVGVCGGIAAYKSADIVRQLKKQGALVRVVMTSNATRSLLKPSVAARSMSTFLKNVPIRPLNISPGPRKLIWQ